MNRFPIWKYLVIAVVLIVSTIYTLPNFFGETPAVQISSTRQSATVDTALMARVETVLQQQGIKPAGLFLDGNSLKVRFNDPDTQIKARDIIQQALGDTYIIALNLLAASPEWLSKLHANPMFLGLDLRGGVHFLLEVDMQAAVDKTMERYAGDIRRELKTAKIRYGAIKRTGNTALEVQLRDQETLNAAADKLARSLPSLTFSSDDQLFRLSLALKPEEITRIQSDAVSQNITTLHNRVNELGVAEPVIQQAGPSRIVVQLPGVQDTAKAKDILGRTATLQVRMVEDDPSRVAEAMAGNVPTGYELLDEASSQGIQKILLKKDVELTGDNINSAQPGFDQNGGASVDIGLDSTGAEIFRSLTAENIGKRMAMVLVEKNKSEVVTAPVIRSEIGGGRVQISGSMNPAEANDVALLLRAGSLAAPMNIIEERTIGPSLGKENIEKGFSATLWGFAAIAVFMVLYYRVFGLISVASLGVNLFMLIALLSMLQATLTLPGIAAIALTLGMAIDANVLINERIREELRNGVPPQSAIQAGYAHAWATILDSNVTTLIAGIALLVFGSGPVRGFAVVHCLGILTSMFSAVLVSRGIVNLWYGRRRRLTAVSIGQVWKPETK
ncbi:preprotein translocase subunit SecD [Vogesella sp. EB]|jgi:preprotein translocase subunit SecD|uniref:Protein translocase subunit SecD n=1 Tax=Vogesella indigofera TaxID=45465 RepID=A0A495B340_VOGIN|nr:MULTISPECIES: protein translocase subunit SecD [Vogesella]KMJ52464.1 preprotein translocase subunit SecD [Vogesella sp. EB]RKQ55382.1 preprotein translocase subunit SecD [Vogesella indigofera]